MLAGRRQTITEGRRRMMKIEVNGEATEFASPCTISELLKSLEMTGKRVAVAVNRAVVPRSMYPDHILATGDRIEILEAVGGG